MNKRRLLVLALLVLAWSLPGAAWAVTCKKGGFYGTISEVIALEQEVLVSTASLVPGALLWRSRPYTVSFTCYDTDLAPQGEDAYFYWDPKKQMQLIHDSLEVGVTYLSIDYNPKIRGEDRTKIGAATGPISSWIYCNAIGLGLQRASCANPRTVTVTFSVYIKATGNPPPASGRITNTGAYSAFQVDGVNGLNKDEGKNYNLYISGLGNIRFVSCNPVISIIGSRGNTVDFGRITAGTNVETNKIEKTVQFSVRTSLETRDSGLACMGRRLVASFSSGNQISGQDAIIPDNSGGAYGITITPLSSLIPIPMRTTVELGVVDGGTVETKFNANFKWLNTNVRPGPFNASAVVNVTLQ